jgi:hypothetical protein
VYRTREGVGLLPGMPAVPGPLAEWIRERGMDNCLWQKAPLQTRKVRGRDAWRCGSVVLVRVPVGSEEQRFYAGVRSSDTAGRVIGYWLEVRRLATGGEQNA